MILKRTSKSTSAKGNGLYSLLQSCLASSLIADKQDVMRKNFALRLFFFFFFFFFNFSRAYIKPVHQRANNTAELNPKVKF